MHAAFITLHAQNIEERMHSGAPAHCERVAFDDFKKTITILKTLQKLMNDVQTLIQQALTDHEAQRSLFSKPSKPQPRSWAVRLFRVESLKKQRLSNQGMYCKHHSKIDN